MDVAMGGAERAAMDGVLRREAAEAQQPRPPTLERVVRGLRCGSSLPPAGFALHLFLGLKSTLPSTDSLLWAPLGLRAKAHPLVGGVVHHVVLRCAEPAPTQGGDAGVVRGDAVRTRRIPAGGHAQLRPRAPPMVACGLILSLRSFIFASCWDSGFGWPSQDSLRGTPEEPRHASQSRHRSWDRLLGLSTWHRSRAWPRLIRLSSPQRSIAAGPTLREKHALTNSWKFEQLHRFVVAKTHERAR